ncbi:hypothetical protein MJO28_013954, partial [Puccinia striiformis f. sp. tritici]
KIKIRHRWARFPLQINPLQNNHWLNQTLNPKMIADHASHASWHPWSVTRYPPDFAHVKAEENKTQKSRIRMDLGACELLAQKSVMAYHYSATRNHSMAATAYKDFLSQRQLASKSDASNIAGKTIGVGRSLKSVQRRSRNLEGSGDLKAAVQLLQKHLQDLTIDSNHLDDSSKNLLVEMHLQLAEGEWAWVGMWRRFQHWSRSGS